MGIKLKTGTNKTYLRFIRPITNELQYLQTLLNAFIKLIQYRLRFSSQIIYLTRYLNDTFDTYQRRIYIVNTNNAIINYLFNKLEFPISPTQERYLLRKSEVYNDSTAYVLNDIVSYLGSIYRAKGATTGNPPPDNTYWFKEADSFYMFRKGERSVDYHFLVYVPNTLTIDTNVFDDEIKRYIFSGIKYQIIYY